MTLFYRLRVSIVLILVVVLACSFYKVPSITVHASSNQYSEVYVSPVTTCCSSATAPPYNVGDSFTVGVYLNLVAGQVFNGFDVRINYTNPHSGVTQGVLSAQRIDYSTNIFSNPNYSHTILEQCIDGVAVDNGAGCINDVLGQVHFGEFVLGRTLSGPLTSAQLFQITFQVTGGGTSLFTVDVATIVNPTPDPSNPSLVSPQYLPVLKPAAIFSNVGVTAFFDYQPDYSRDTMISPSILPNQPASFDASNSFVANDSAMGFKSYYWNFGDGYSQNVTGPSVFHSFSLPGNYTVKLTATDNKGQTGNITRQVHVLPALGNLALVVQDQGGTIQRGNVEVKIFNSTSSGLPFLTRTTDANGQVNINGLIPGPYYLTFSGPGIVTSSKTETAIPGFTQQDTVHVSLVAQPPDYSGLIYIGTILGGLAIITVLIIYQKAKARRGEGKIPGQSSSQSKYRKNRTDRSDR